MAFINGVPTGLRKQRFTSAQGILDDTILSTSSSVWREIVESDINATFLGHQDNVCGAWLCFPAQNTMSLLYYSTPLYFVECKCNWWLACAEPERTTNKVAKAHK